MNTAFFEALVDHPVVIILGWTLVHFIWQAAFLGLVVALALALAKRASSAMRYAISSAGLALIVIIPIGTLAYLAAMGEIADGKENRNVAVSLFVQDIQAPPLAGRKNLDFAEDGNPSAAENAWRKSPRWDIE